MAGAGDAPGPSGLETFLVESTGAGGAQTGWLKVDGAVRWLSAGGGKVDLYEVPEGTGRTRPAAGDLKLVYSFEADWVKRVVAERSREKPAFVIHMKPNRSPVELELTCKCFANTRQGGHRTLEERQAQFDGWTNYFAGLGVDVVPGAVDTKQFEEESNCTVL